MSIIKNIKKDSEKKHVKNKTLSEEGKNKRQKRLEKDIKILLKKKKKSVNIIVNLIKIFLWNKKEAN